MAHTMKLINRDGFLSQRASLIPKMLTIVDHNAIARVRAYKLEAQYRRVVV
jgi:hypothetical protein